MKYRITFKWETSETNTGDIVVEADSEEEALRSVQEIYEDGYILRAHLQYNAGV